MPFAYLICAWRDFLACRQLALFHRFEWLQETVEYILVADGEMDAAPEQTEDIGREEGGINGGS